MISPNLQRIIEVYFTERGELHSLIESLNQKQLTEALEELIALYAMDKNSSTLREIITLAIAKCERLDKKLGPNGWDADKQPVEVKPVNIQSTAQNPKKLNGGGNFTDFTYGRLDKYRNNEYIMLVSGFVDAELVYVFRFPFICEDFVNHLETKLDKKFGGRCKPRKPGDYLRSASFTFEHYRNCKDLRLLYQNQSLIEKYKSHFAKKFLEFLKSFVNKREEQ